jgi:hypothetical protein
MKHGPGGLSGLPLVAVLAVFAVELTFFLHCSIEVNESTAQKRFIALDAPCNELHLIYGPHIDCKAMKKSLDPRMSWVETGQCMVYKHNIFSLWGWMELGIAGGAVVAMAYLFYLYKMKTAKYERKSERYYPMLTTAAESGRGYPRRIYSNGLVIEHVE